MNEAFTVRLNPSDARWFTIAYSDESTAADGNRADRIACDIGTQIREQLPPEKRIAEPGRWGVVAGRLATGGEHEFVHTRFGWVNAATGAACAWESLREPRLIREGASS